MAFPEDQHAVGSEGDRRCTDAAPQDRRPTRGVARGAILRCPDPESLASSPSSPSVAAGQKPLVPAIASVGTSHSATLRRAGSRLHRTQCTKLP